MPRPAGGLGRRIDASQQKRRTIVSICDKHVAIDVILDVSTRPCTRNLQPAQGGSDARRSERPHRSVLGRT